MIIQAATQPDESGREFPRAVVKRRLMICCCVLLAAFCFQTPVEAQERTIGHVLDFEGEWYLDGRRGQALSKGEAVPASGVIRIPSPSRFAFIIIRYSDNKQIISRRCRNSGECEQPILLPRAVQRQATYREVFVDTFLGWYRRNPVSAASNAGRSADGVLREAVVQIKSGHVDLAPVFTEMTAGIYHVHVERRMPDGKMADIGLAKRLKVKWDSGVTTTTPAVILQPGLYEVVLLEQRGAEYKPTLTTAWFLAGNLEQYAQRVAQFCEATHVTATWKDEVSEATARGFLRSFLIHLESHSSPGQPAK